MSLKPKSNKSNKTVKKKGLQLRSIIAAEKHLSQNLNPMYSYTVKRRHRVLYITISGLSLDNAFEKIIKEVEHIIPGAKVMGCSYKGTNENKKIDVLFILGMPIPRR